MAMNLLSGAIGFNARAVAAEVRRYLPTVGKIIGQAESRVLFGRQVPSAEKVYNFLRSTQSSSSGVRRKSRLNSDTRYSWEKRGRNLFFIMK